MTKRTGSDRMPTRVELALLLGALVSCFGAAPRSAVGAEIPAYMDLIVDRGAGPSKATVASENVLALDAGMQAIYDQTLAKYTAHMRARVPILLAMFNDAGGQMVLLPAGKDPIVAPSVPPIYAWLKSVSHSTMAVYQLIAPYLLRPADGSWRLPMQSYLAQIQAAAATLAQLDADDEVRQRLRRILDRSAAFLESCLKKGTFSMKDLDEYVQAVEPDIVKNVAMAAQVQVDHWEEVLEGWKKRLGADWEQLYAVTNTLNVTQQNNVLFTILAQSMGEKAIGDRLMLVGTTEFTTTQEDLLAVLVRTVADRSIGKVFFRNYYLMDAELLGGAARHAIDVDAAKQGKKALLPKLAPFHQHAWPWPTDPASGTGPAEMSEIPGD